MAMITRIFFFIPVVLLFSACAPASPPAPDLAMITPPAIIVYISDNSCPSLEARPGMNVVWVNEEKQERILRSEADEDGNRLLDARLKPGEGFTMTFAEPGTVPYICSEDGSLRGTISVTDPNVQPDAPAPLLGSGVTHSCLLNIQGQVSCWGQGSWTGQEISPEEYGKPLKIEGLDAIAIGAGWYHTCAVTRSGRVVCWGQNTSGQLGDNSLEDSSSPVDVLDLNGVVSVSAGAAHTCALTDRGEVYCWGQNTGGQLGDGTQTDRPSPVQVTGLSGPVQSLAAGSTFNCALLTAGPVECWGEFAFIPGDESNHTRASAIPISNLNGNVQQIAAGNYHLCILTTSNEVKCEGMIVPPNDPPFTTLDENLASLQGRVGQILAGTDFNCALTDDGTVYCWGDNYFGQLGDGTFNSSAEPIQVDLKGKKAIALGGGYYTACVLIEDGSITCWGDTSFGQLGDGTVRWK